jgi:hypothetical protein
MSNKFKFDPDIVAANRQKTAASPPTEAEVAAAEAAPAKDSDLDAAAKKLLEHIYAAEPAWRERDEACAAEHGMGPGQRVLKYIAIILDNGLQLQLINGYDVGQPGEKTAADPLAVMHGRCPVPHADGRPQIFRRAYPGQVCCSNDCASKHFPPTAPKQATEYPEGFFKTAEEWFEELNGQEPPQAPQPTTGGRDAGTPTATIIR